ncbi:VWA domain-containing protein [Candidatus Dependentiae bacterium]|nr:MAG: VWA domain-containing protein [Candidatus Dependentiae bacterium]
MKKGHELVHEIQQTAAVFGRNQEATVVFEADGVTGTAWTDGKEITLPSLPDNLEFSHEETMTMRGLLDHEAGHLRHTNFESWQAFGETQSQQALAIANCLEDMRIEDRIMKEYPGAQKNLSVMRETTGVKELEHLKANSEVFTTITAPAIQNAILRAGTRDYTGAINEEMYQMIPERFKAWGHKFADEAKACKNVDEILNLALAIEKLLEESTKNKAPEPMPEDGKPDAGGSGLDGNPEDFKFDKDGDFTQGKPKHGKKATGKLKDNEGNTMLDGPIEAIKEAVKSKVDQFMKEEKPKGTDYRILTDRYDEVFTKTSTNKRKDYRKELLERTSAVNYERTKSNLGGLVNTMKAKLRRALMAKETRDWDFAREFGKLDTKRLVAGSMGSPTVYKQRKDRMEMDTAVHFLIDLSGSMGGSKIKVATDATVAFAECLEGTQIRYQISGFDNSDARNDHYYKLVDNAKRSKAKYHRIEPLNLFKFKEFNQSLQLAKGSIAAIRECASGNNSDRDAIIWAYHELLNRPEKRKILFVLSDGEPANATINISDVYGERSPLVLGLKNAIEECTVNGVECVGIGILTGHVKDLYPKSVSISKVEDLSGAIFNQLSNLLTGGKVRL